MHHPCVDIYEKGQRSWIAVLVLECSKRRKFSIRFDAISSMTDDECRHRIGEDRVVLIARYRAVTEQALAKADFVNTVEMSNLQAMTIYLLITACTVFYVAGLPIMLTDGIRPQFASTILAALCGHSQAWQCEQRKPWAYTLRIIRLHFDLSEGKCADVCGGRYVFGISTRPKTVLQTLWSTSTPSVPSSPCISTVNI